MLGSVLPANLLDSLTEGCQLIGRDWTYRYLNEAAARQGRRSRDELLGQTMMASIPASSTPRCSPSSGSAWRSRPAR